MEEKNKYNQCLLLNGYEFLDFEEREKKYFKNKSRANLEKDRRVIKC